MEKQNWFFNTNNISEFWFKKEEYEEEKEKQVGLVIQKLKSKSGVRM